MDWINGIQNALNYIEENILLELDYEEIAKQAYSSAYHFQRVFSMLCGCTLGEYIRKRRLTLAAQELASANVKIIDIALKYAYDSPDSFSKAFSRFHGITPSQAKEKGVVLNALSPLFIKLSLEGGTNMKYRIEHKDEMIFTCFKERFQGSPEARLEQEADFTVRNRVNTFILQGLAGDNETQYCIISNIDDDGFDYYIAMILDEHTRKNISSPMYIGEEAKRFENFTVPAATYAVFETERVKKPVALYGELRKRIAAEWLPASKYSIANAPEIVVMHWLRGAKREEKYFEVWMPIES